jgi:hypothetical protein
MSPPSTDASKMQEELVKKFSESAVRVANAWSETLKGAGLQSGSADERPPTAGWPDFSGRLRGGIPGASPKRFQEIVERAARDLPDLLKQGRDDETIRRIKNNWLKAYEDFSRELMGIPAPTATEKALTDWKALWERTTGAGHSLGPLHDFPAAPFAPAWFPAGRQMGTGPDLFRTWAETYEKTLQGMFPPTVRPGLLGELDKSYRQTLEAQIGFLTSLAGFQQQIAKTASRVVDNIVDAMAHLDVKEVSEDTYGLFYRTWLGQNEKAFQDLLESDVFSDSLRETAQYGAEAKKKIESLLAEGFSAFNTSNRADVEELSRSVELMRVRIDGLEQEVKDLRRQVIALAGDESQKEDLSRQDGTKV